MCTYYAVFIIDINILTLLSRLYMDDLFAWLQLGVDAEGLQRFAVTFNEAKTKIETDSPKHSGK